ncbi:MAG: hypothetical protein HGA25_10040, partial [Clostridiales bacterium]|nr:hypothetical protein [Clostridiales bacterium]
YTYNAYTYDRNTNTYNMVPGGGNQNPFRATQRTQIENLFFQAQLSYNKKFGDHTVAAVGAYELSNQNNVFFYFHTVPPNNYIFPMYFENADADTQTYEYSARASFIGRFGTGLPYTPSLQNQRTGLENSDNKPTFYDVDFYLTKYFEIAASKVSVFVKIYNLFDTLNEINVFGDTGRAGDTLELTRNQTPPRGVNTTEEFFTRPDFYSSPRQIVLGADFSF